MMFELWRSSPLQTMPADSLTTWRDKLAENVPTDCKCGVSSIFGLSIVRFVVDIQGSRVSGPQLPIETAHRADAEKPRTR